VAKAAEDYTALINAIDAEEMNSYGADGDGTLAQERATSIENYLGKNNMPAPDGRSQIIDRTVYETIQQIKPSLARIFSSGDDVIEAQPVGPEDEEGSKQESQYLNHVLLQKNDWFSIFDTAATDALLTKAGYLYVYASKQRQIEREKYEKQTAESLGLIMQDQPEIIDLKEYPDPDYQAPPPQPMPDPMTGQPVIGPDGQPVMMPPPPPPMLYDVEIRRTKVETNYCVEPLPPERCKVSQNCKTVQVSRLCPYFEYYDFPTISELRQEGYEVPDDVNDNDNDALEDAARDQFGERRWNDTNTIDPAMRRVKCRWVWIRYDFDGDGIAELQYVVRVGQTVLYREEVNRIPIGVLCPDPLPHRHVGQCPGDTVSDLQQINTVIIRQGLDNLQLSQNPRTFVTQGMINLDDLKISRPGGIVRGKQGAVFGQHIMPFETPFVFDKAMAALEYMDSKRESRSGVNRYFAGTDQNALNKTASGVAQLSTMAAQRVEQIARHMAPGVLETGSILHELILKSGHKKEVVKLRGKWVEVNPADWRTRTDFKLCVGYAAGNKDAQVARLMNLAMLQEKAMAGGLPIVNPRNVYETAIEITKASDFSNPERFWQDPSQAPPKAPPQPDVTVVTMEQIKAQSAREVKLLDVQQKERDSQRDYELKRLEIEVDASLQTHTLDKSHQQQKELKLLEGEQTAGIEHVKAQLNPKTVEAGAKQAEVKQKETAFQTLLAQMQKSEERQEQMLAKVLEGVAALAGPKQIVRGKDGRATHVVPAS
jgi:hypothetical protein